MLIEVNKFIKIKYLNTIIIPKESEDHQSNIKISLNNICIKLISHNINHIIINLDKMYTILIIILHTITSILTNTLINTLTNIQDTPYLNIEENSYQLDQ